MEIRAASDGRLRGDGGVVQRHRTVEGMVRCNERHNSAPRSQPRVRRRAGRPDAQQRVGVVRGVTGRVPLKLRGARQQLLRRSEIGHGRHGVRSRNLGESHRRRYMPRTASQATVAHRRRRAVRGEDPRASMTAQRYGRDQHQRDPARCSSSSAAAGIGGWGSGRGVPEGDARPTIAAVEVGVDDAFGLTANIRRRRGGRAAWTGYSRGVHAPEGQRDTAR